MSLTRARVVAGPPALHARVTEAIRSVLVRPRDSQALVNDVAEMRERIEAERGTTDPWDVKYARGGLIDLQFLAQYLQLRHAQSCPDLLGGSTAEAYEKLGKFGFVSDTVARQMVAAARLFLNIQGMLRLTISGNFQAANAPDALRSALARAGGGDSLDTLRARLIDIQSQVLVAYNSHIARQNA